jgi:hypothetical protein
MNGKILLEYRRVDPTPLKEQKDFKRIEDGRFDSAQHTYRTSQIHIPMLRLRSAQESMLRLRSAQESKIKNSNDLCLGKMSLGL